ncbi:hypothetical protein HPB49_018252 [Dermacentor silvarum]|uniref:Uncharacterized protein n=1 Tax=Dermacentor silvarum TaxID=543639 RepID=A0ACB8CYV1_DERSI|nr:hypothetical protein HPB49_018252 [Dermacentor silvarum]
MSVTPSCSGRPYIRVTHDISIEEVLNIFTREWKFTLPRIVLVIISSLTTWQEWSAPRQLENFKEGLIKVGTLHNLIDTSPYLLDDKTWRT